LEALDGRHARHSQPHDSFIRLRIVNCTDKLGTRAPIPSTMR
jgi:hypothetical protein